MIGKLTIAPVVISLGLIASLSIAGVDIIRDGKPNATIVIGANQKALAKSAAEILQSRLFKATGAELPIADEGAQIEGNRIIVGGGKLAQALGLDTAALSYDGFLIYADGSNTVAIAGADAAVGRGRQGVKHGTLNGVYRFLESAAGIHWIWPGDDGWLIPPHRTISVPRMLLKDEPRMLMRCLPRLPDYQLTGNGVAIFGGGGHSWHLLLPAGKYYRDHPEYFAKDADGKPLKIEMNPKTGEPVNINHNSICCANPDVKRVIAENIRNLFDQGYAIVALGQMDSWGGQCPACQCAGCRRLDGTEADGHVNARRVMNFHLSIARELYKTHPGGKVWISAYGPCGSCYTWLKKDNMPPNVIIEVTGGGKEHIAKWSAVAPAITHYYYGWGIYELLERSPRTTAAEIADYIRHLAGHNGRGIFWCGGCFNWGLAGDQYFLAARLMWNPDEDPARILETYYSFFGESRAPMRRFFETLRATVGAFPKEKFTKNIQAQAYAACFPPAALDEMEAWLQKAETGAANELTSRRIQVVRDCFDYTALTARACHLHQAYGKDLSLDAFLAMKQMVDLRAQRIREIFARHGYDPRLHPQGLPFTVNGLPAPFADRGDNPEKVIYGGRGRDGHGGMGKLGYPFDGKLDQELQILAKGPAAISGTSRRAKLGPSARKTRPLLANGDFEQLAGDGGAFAHWQTNFAAAAAAAVSGESRSGRHSLRATIDRGSNYYVFARSEPAAIGGGQPLSITASVKVQRAVYRTVFGLQIAFIPEKGKSLEGAGKHTLSLGRIARTDWTELSGSYITPLNTAQAQVAIWGAGASGEFLVDDVQILVRADDGPGLSGEADIQAVPGGAGQPGE